MKVKHVTVCVTDDPFHLQPQECVLLEYDLLTRDQWVEIGKALGIDDKEEE